MIKYLIYISTFLFLRKPNFMNVEILQHFNHNLKIIKLKNRSQLEPFQLEFAPYNPWIGRQTISAADPP